MNNIKKGIEPIKIIEENTSFLGNYTTIQKIQNDVLNEQIKDQKFRRTLQNKNLIIMGAAGCSKTSSIHEIIKTRNEFIRSKTTNKWFDPFPEKFLTTYLIDDVAPEFITEFETEVKNWTDRTPCTQTGVSCVIEYKGETRLLSPICRWVLTSNYNQEELLSRFADNRDSSNKKAFIRRFQWLQIVPDDTEDSDIELLNNDEKNHKCIKTKT